MSVLAAWSATLLKRLQHKCFLVKFAKFLRISFFCITPPEVASVQTPFMDYLINFKIIVLKKTSVRSRPVAFFNKCVLKNFTKFTEKHLR